MSLLFGVDVGTTAVKCAVVRTSANHELLAASYVALADVPLSTRSAGAVQGEQQVEQVLLAVHKAITTLSAELREQVASIGICGQMHGIIWWRSSSVQAHVQELLKPDRAAARASDERARPAWSKLITWQDQRCSPAFLHQCNTAISARKAASSSSSSSSPLATGYGLATYAHTLATEPGALEGFDACGTIQDFVAFMLCGHSSREAASIDTTNAFSWGGFDIESGDWNRHTVSALQIPLEMLPTVKQPGAVIGHVPADAPFGFASGTSVSVPIGDHPSSVLAALVQQQQQSHDQDHLETNLTLVNFGTSAQLALLLSADEVKGLHSASKSFEVRPFLFANQFVGVAASLSGGNTFAWFVKQCREWIQELQMNDTSSRQSDSDDDDDDARWYKRLIDLGLAKLDTKLVFHPTLNGERADPDVRGSIQQLRMSNGSLGDVSAALCRGLVDNLFRMVPEELHASVASRKMIGTGSALVRNELLRRCLAAKLSDPARQLQIQHAADAAVGAALAPVCLLPRPR